MMEVRCSLPLEKDFTCFRTVGNRLKKMATDVLRPLLQDVVSKLPQDEAKTACGNICSTFGQKYSMHQNLLSLLEALTTDNRISPSNTFLLEECVPHSKTSKGRIQKSINEFQRKNKQLLTPTAPNRSFVGRKERAVELSKLMQDDERHGVLLWGHSGVGKTTIAKEFLKTWEGSRRIVDLREVTDIRVVISEVLRSFGRPISIKDASMDSLISTLKSCKSTLKGKSVLLFDNADYFISNKEDEFADVTRNVVSSLEGQAKLLITSRNMCSLPEASVFLHQQQLQSLEVEPSKSILKNNMIHQRESEENINRTVGLCKSLPLNLNILGALLQDHDISLENILPEIEQLVQNLQKQELQKEVPVQDKTEQFTDVIVQNSFDRLSDTLQRGAVGLSLFARSFSFQSVKEVLKNYTDQQINLILESLRHVNLISMSFEEKTQRVYDVHPKVKQFLKEKASDEQFISFYQTFKSNFTSFFKSRLTNLSHLMEQDYLKAFELFHDDYANFEFLLDISQEGGAPVLLDDHYDLQTIGLLFESMFQNEKRLSLYQTWAAKAEREGKTLLAAQFLCQSSILLGYKNPTTALREELAKAESLFEGMRQEPEGRSEQFKIVDALHSYTKGDLLYMIARGNQSIENIRQGINAVEHSIVIRESLFQRGHTDLVRSYFELGNFYNMFGDLSDEGSTQQKDNWKMALKYYNKAWKMRTSLTKSELHLDLPNLLQSIATIYNNVGNNGKAIKFYKKALDIEKKLKVDGFYNTAVIKANVANCYRDMNKMNEAIEYAFDSLDIRKRLSGKHPDTVRSLYLVAVLFHCKGDYKEAINYYKEAFEMEEGLEPQHHSWHRMDIRRDMLFAFEDLIHRGGFEFQEEYEEWKDRFAAMQVAEQSSPGLPTEGETGIWQAESGNIPSDSVAITDTSGVYSQSMDSESVTLKSTASTGNTSNDNPDVQEVSQQLDQLAFEETTESIESETEGIDPGMARMFVDDDGALFKFRYLGVTVKLPEDCVMSPVELQLSKTPLSNVQLKLHPHERLISDVILFGPDGEIFYKPAELKIRHRVNNQELYPYTEIVVKQFEEVTDEWIDLDTKCSREIEDDEHKKYPVAHALIQKTSMFAVVLTLTPVYFTVPREGLSIKPFEKEEVQLQFKPKTFEGQDTKCILRIRLFSRSAISYSQHQNMILTPVIYIDSLPKKQLLCPVKITLPLLCDTDYSRDPKGITVLCCEETSKWEDITSETLPELDMDLRVSFQIQHFCGLAAIWTVGEEVANKMKQFVDPVKWLNSSEQQLRAAEAEFFLYKEYGALIASLDRLRFCVACTTLDHELQERMERDIGRNDLYELVENQMSMESLIDRQQIAVDIRGQLKPDLKNIRLKFKSDHWSYQKFRVLRTEEACNEPDYVYFTEYLEPNCSEEAKEICVFPYQDKIALDPFPDIDKEEARRNAPFRFLGLKLTNCSFEDITYRDIGVINQLAGLGFDETIIRETALKTERCANELITKDILDLITYYFARKQLAKDWFNAFFQSLDLKHVKESTKKVMDLLMEPLNSASPKVKELYDTFIKDKQMAFLWKVLGRNLKSKHGSIENIERDYNKGGYQCQCDEMLKLWASSNEDTQEESKTFLEIIRALHIGRTTKTEIARRQDLLDRLGETIERIVGLSSGDS